LSDQLKDIADDRNLFLVWNEQLLILGIIVSEWRIAAVPIIAGTMLFKKPRSSGYIPTPS
jgi:hypothetical protein